MIKQANPGKVMALMKSGKSPEEAIRGAYPGWDDRKVRRAAAMLKSAMSAGAIKQAAASGRKPTFSPAMDKSPHLKGRQSRLPDHVQAAILKKKGKEKTASPMLLGLREASSALYTSHFERHELEKVAFFGTSIGKGVANWALKGGGAGAVAGGAKAIQDMNKWRRAAQGAEKFTPEMTETLARGRRIKSGKEVAEAGDNSRDIADFVDKMEGLKGKKFSENWADYIGAYAPHVMSSAAQTGLAGAGVGAAAKAGLNAYGKHKTMQTAKKVAPWVAGGVGAGMLLSGD